MLPKQSPTPATPLDRQPEVEQPCDRQDSVEEALLVLSRMLGRQAARDWLSADLCPPEGSDDE